MPQQQSFSSFKELLIKKDLQTGDDKREVRYNVLTDIFRYVQKNVILEYSKHFDDGDRKIIEELIERPEWTDTSRKLSNGEYEAMVRDSLKSLDEGKKVKLIDILEKESKVAFRENQKREKMMRRYQPEDPKEKLELIIDRIKDLQGDIIDIEMTLMQMESDGLKNGKGYHKVSNARERRKQALARLEKDKVALEKKLKV